MGLGDSGAPDAVTAPVDGGTLVVLKVPPPPSHLIVTMDTRILFVLHHTGYYILSVCFDCYKCKQEVSTDCLYARSYA